MATFELTESDYELVNFRGANYKALRQVAYDRFGIDVLGLGDLSSKSREIDAIAVMFDLEQFTTFCSQPGPEMIVPPFMRAFLKWMVDSLKTEVHDANVNDRLLAITHPLPFYLKFMGDGLLVLWRAPETNVIGRRNIIASSHTICEKYTTQFLPSVRRKYPNLPQALRCGIARGKVMTIGNGSDYIGNCINMSARLQKLPGISFAFSLDGIDLKENDPTQFFNEEIVIREVSIRGLSGQKLVGVLKNEMDRMPPENLSTYREID